MFSGFHIPAWERDISVGHRDSGKELTFVRFRYANRAYGAILIAPCAAVCLLHLTALLRALLYACD